MNADPRVMRFFPSVLTGEESRAMWDRMRAELDEKGYGLYAVELKSSGSLIGLLGFHWADFEADFNAVRGDRLEARAGSLGTRACHGRSRGMPGTRIFPLGL